MNIPMTMRGVQLVGHGGPENLVWNDAIPTPRPGPGEVLIRVAAAGINNTDINTRVGWYSKSVTGATEGAETSDAADASWSGSPLALPRIQGADIAGRIVAVGDGVDAGRIGARVVVASMQPRPTADNLVGLWTVGSECDGGFAEYAVAESAQTFDVNCDLTDVELAAIPCAFSTAENMLIRAGVAEGWRVLVTGASGGVGLAAVQLARLRGAEVIGQTSPAKADAVRAAGAVTIGRDDLPEAPVDAVIDLVGGPNWARVLSALRPGGAYAVAGAIAGPIVPLDLRDLYLKDWTFHGCTWQAPGVFESLMGWVNSGRLRPLVSKTYPLAEIAAAQADFMAKTYPGKLVLIPPTEDER